MGPGIGGAALAAPGDLNPTAKPRRPGTTARVGGMWASHRADDWAELNKNQIQPIVDFSE